MIGRYRASHAVGPFDFGDEVVLDDTDPTQGGYVRSGWFELLEVVAVFAPADPVDLGGYEGPTNPELVELFSQPDVIVGVPSGVDAQGAGGVGSDVGTRGRRKSRRAVRGGNDPTGVDPGAGAVPEGHQQPGKLPGDDDAGVPDVRSGNG